MLSNYLPILKWLPKYKKEFLKGDLSAGLTVGIMLIPQGMAYAMIAGLPPVYGLYASIIPQIIYAIFGTSRQLAVGPVAMDSLIVAAGVCIIAESGTEAYIELAILLSLLMGLIQILFSFLSFGKLVKHIKRPVILGFTNAAALIIGINQVKHLVGIEIQNGNIFQILKTILLQFNQFNLYTIILAVLSIFILVILKQINKKIPGALIVVIITTLLTFFLNLHQSQVNIVQEIPKGLPSFNFSIVNWKDIVLLFPTAITLAIVAYLESFSVAKAIQNQHKETYELNNNQELFALGMSNLIGYFFNAYPTTGGFSRSAVNNDAGAKTNLAAIISAILIIFTLLFLTTLFYYLPHAALGAIIITAVFGLIKIKEVSSFYHSCKLDFVLIILTTVMTLVVGITYGIIIGVLISIVFDLIKLKYPDICNKSYDTKQKELVN